MKITPTPNNPPLRQRISAPSVCYLCDQLLVEPTNNDHVPPQSFFAPSVRKAEKPQLLTIRVHEGCNTSFRLDEEYFGYSLTPFALGSCAGNALNKHMREKSHRMKNRRLVMQILGEVEPRPAGLVLPGGKVVKRFDSNRIERVIWKIVRGLFSHHHGKTLPQKLKLTWTFTGPDDGPPPEHFQNFTANHSSYGKYPGVFAYQFDAFRNLLTSGIPRAQRSDGRH